MKFSWVLSVFCLCAITCGCKPHAPEQTAAEKKMADFIREERIREIEVSKKRIDELVASLADFDKRVESEEEISYKLTGNRFAHQWGNYVPEKEAYLRARANYNANKLDRDEKAKERINKELADLRLHLRSLLDSESKSSSTTK
jgi:hypothetical protein